MNAPPAAKPPLWIALTGGIASGKSTVAHQFAELGVPVIDTDQLAREAVEPGTPALATLVEHFGQGILDTQGELDRAAMRKRVFQDANARRFLEQTLHPAIRALQKSRSAMLGGDYQIHAVPLLVESGTTALYGRVLLVDCRPETQLQRLLQRDHITSELAMQMLNAQASRTARQSIADDTIDSEQSLQSMANRVAELHKCYLKLAQESGAK